MLFPRLLVSILALSFGLVSSLFGQFQSIKFGKIDPSGFEIKDCNFEPGASAMVLIDHGDGYFEYDQSRSQWSYVLVRHKRVKILTVSGVDEATVDLKIFAGESGEFERIDKIKAASYTEENGAVQEQKLDAKRDVYETDLGHGYKSVKFAIPGAKAGSIIEYTYELRSLNIGNLENWYFQSHLPVVHSEFHLMIPNIFVFQLVPRGRQKLDTSYVEARKAYGMDSEGHHWLMTNVPSYQPEVYAAAAKDFAPHIEFQLTRIGASRDETIDLISSYQKLNERLLEEYSFGRMARPDGYLKKMVDEITSSADSEGSRATAILDYFQNKLKWDGVTGILADSKAKSLFEQGTGDAATINLQLVAAFRAAGLQADPVILGTRAHARPHPVYPNVEKFDYVIAAVELDGKLVLADATHPDIPLGFISERCLHAEGWRVSENLPGWIPLHAGASSNWSTVLNLAPEGQKLAGTVFFKQEDYEAINAMAAIRKDQSALLDQLAKTLDGWNPTDIKYSNIDKQALKLQAEGTVSIPLEDEEVIYMSPVKIDFFTENPFFEETRVCPINFPYKMQRKYVIRIQLPDGYGLEEVPEDMNLVFGDNKDMIFRYNSSVMENELMVISSLQMNRTEYLPTEYEDLRKFFDYMVAKNQELIVLSKTR